MANQWFRMYAEFANDPKVQRLSEIVQRRFIMLLCMKCNGDETLHDDDIVFLLRVSPDEWVETKSILRSKNLIDENNNPVNWAKRQYVSDSSTTRVRACRERKKQNSTSETQMEHEDETRCNVSETPQTRTRPDQNITDQTRARNGFEKNGFGGLVGRFELTEDTLEKLPSVAPGWNAQRLLELYEPHRVKMGRADHPQAAFIGWAKSFTKGMRPS